MHVRHLLILLIATGSAWAQPTTFQDDLLDSLIGTWVLHGTIEGRETTHDVSVDWVLGHQYIRISETSRERMPDGTPEYEAIVFIGWDARGKRHACQWLDNTGGGGLDATAIGHGVRSGNSIPFRFETPGGAFHNTFSFDPGSGSWQWLMQSEDKGALVEFARVRLDRTHQR